MATDHPIPPFPADVDRDAFGHYLSGFTDGEGSFLLALFHDKRKDRWQAQAKFKIYLRDDDAEILRLIQSYWRCGAIYRDPRLRDACNPAAGLCVETVSHLATVVVPHFDRYPLRAKKARDFAIWREAVSLAYEVNQQPFSYAPRRQRLWTDELLGRYRSLRQRLSDGRQYRRQE